MTIRAQTTPTPAYSWWCQCGHPPADHAGGTGRRSFTLNGDYSRGACRYCACTTFVEAGNPSTNADEVAHQ